MEQEDEIFRGLFEDGRYSKLTAMEKKEYKKSVLEYADVQDAIRCAQQKSLKAGIEQGREEGGEQGREEGIEQGREQGIEQGREVERRHLAINMLAEGIAPAMVARISGLTEEEVLALSQE